MTDSDCFLFIYVHGNGRCLQQVPSEAEVSPGWTWVWAPCSLVQDGATLHLWMDEHWEESLIEDTPPPAEEEWSGRTPQCPAAAGVWGWPWTGSEGHLHARLEEQANMRYGLFVLLMLFQRCGFIWGKPLSAGESSHKWTFVTSIYHFSCTLCSNCLLCHKTFINAQILNASPCGALDKLKTVNPPKSSLCQASRCVPQTHTHTNTSYHWGGWVCSGCDTPATAPGCPAAYWRRAGPAACAQPPQSLHCSPGTSCRASAGA